mmetsp:Transcript_2101/g.3970  ORF Transcript_2101/g.3970 Transcript_2101/m.3970 type:complete len:106 (-) Transcript_2101:672-989(-)
MIRTGNKQANNLKRLGVDAARLQQTVITYIIVDMILTTLKLCQSILIVSNANSRKRSEASVNRHSETAASPVNERRTVYRERVYWPRPKPAGSRRLFSCSAISSF